MIDVVLPALNEAGAIARLCSLMPPGYRPIVVDNGSTDGTAGVAAAAGATVVREDVRGFGAACFAGLMAASADIVCFMDADGSLDPRELPLVTERIADGTARLMMGSRQPDRGAWPASARLMNRALAVELRRRTRAPLHDLGPMRAARRQDLIDLGIRDRRFGWPLEMVLRAANEGWAIGEVPVRYAARIGKSKVTGTVRGTVRTIRDMSRVLAA